MADCNHSPCSRGAGPGAAPASPDNANADNVSSICDKDESRRILSNASAGSTSTPVANGIRMWG